MVRVSAGDYLLLSNSGQTLWRIQRYEDGPSYGLDLPRDVQVWSCARYRGTPEEAQRDPDLLERWDHWVETAGHMRTRREAVTEALETSERRGI